jgi:hypothetical protein
MRKTPKKQEHVDQLHKEPTQFPKRRTRGNPEKERPCLWIPYVFELAEHARLLYDTRVGGGVNMGDVKKPMPPPKKRKHDVHTETPILENEEENVEADLTQKDHERHVLHWSPNAM